MRCRTGSMNVMRLYMPAKFLLVTVQRTSRSVHKLKQNRYISVKNNQDFHSGMTEHFGLNRPSSSDNYKNFKIRYNIVQIVSVIWDSV